MIAFKSCLPRRRQISIDRTEPARGGWRSSEEGSIHSWRKLTVWSEISKAGSNTERREFHPSAHREAGMWLQVPLCIWACEPGATRVTLCTGNLYTIGTWHHQPFPIHLSAHTVPPCCGHHCDVQVERPWSRGFTSELKTNPAKQWERERDSLHILKKAHASPRWVCWGEYFLCLQKIISKALIILLVGKQTIT